MSLNNFHYLLELKIHSGIFRWNDGLLEKRCSSCREYYPQDTEFFHRNRYEFHGFMRQCKACYIGYSRKATMKRKGIL